MEGNGDHRRPDPARRRLLAGAGAALGLAAAGTILPAPVWASIEPAGPRLFGYAERRNSVIAPFIKWTGTLERYFAERQLDDSSCESSFFNRCYLEEWQELLVELRSVPVREQIEEVNRYMNRARYIVDPVNYRMPDYWATPAQFFVNQGDCEDYAIAKYLSLRALDYPLDHMRVVVLMDENLRIAHALLAVYQDGDILILDNQISRTISHSRIQHYRPIYSINEQAWWMHSVAG